MGWSSFPPAHKKSFFIGLSLYGLSVCLIGGWVWLHAAATRHDWQERTPHAQATVSKAYPGGTIASGGTASNPFAHDAIAPPEGDGGAVTIVMSGLGLAEDVTQRALDELPAKMPLAFSPYSPGLQDWLKKAGKAGRDRLVLVPMEPLTYPRDDPGPLALLTRQSGDVNARHLSFILDNAPGVTGVMNQMGSAFLGDSKDMQAFFEALKKHNEYFIEDAAGNLPQAAVQAKESGVPYLAADMTIDKSVSPLDIHQQLLDLEKLARKRGYALAVARPYPLTFSILHDWAASLGSRKITLVTPAQLFQIAAEKKKEAQEQEQQGQALQPVDEGNNKEDDGDKAEDNTPDAPVTGGVVGPDEDAAPAQEQDKTDE
ncbi:MAG: hypothetical protein GC185_00320 [Alphaproteobacteria bacterium]|nr:hypothetical protein [Alphaproteobacteria bacterium]